jgi:hypothetical protein
LGSTAIKVAFIDPSGLLIRNRFTLGIAIDIPVVGSSAES